MSDKKSALSDILAKARALSEIPAKERTEEQNVELKSFMDDGKALRDEIVREATLDDFAGKIADVDPKDSAKSATEQDYAVLGRDGGQRNAPLLIAEKKGFEDAVKAWKSGRRDAKWGFEARYKMPLGTGSDLSNSTAETESPVGVFNGAGGPTENAGQFSGAVSPFYYPGIIEPPTRTPLIADLFAQGSTDSNLVRLVKETFTSADSNGGTGNVDTGGHGVTATAEGTPYGSVQLEVSPVDWPVRDITGILPVTEDILMDIPAISSYLSMRLSKFVQLAEEAELVNGNGTGSHLEGLLSLASTTVDTQGAFDLDTAVMRLMARTYQRSFLDPQWVVMNPNVWARYVTLRTNLNGGQGAFLAGVPNAAATRTIWGLPITVTPVVPTNTIILGNSAAGMIFRNGGLRVESSTGYGTFFGEGLVAIRGKVRTAFASFRPQGIGILDLSS
jgi:HK97 family phage major capsid protein